MNSKQEEKDSGIIIETLDNDVLVEVQRKGSCKNCSVNMLCMGNSEKIRFNVKKPSFAVSPGDHVFLEIAPADRIFSSFVLFIFPILAMLLFYVIIRYALALSEDFAIFGSLLGLLLSGVVIKMIDNLASKKVMVKITSLKRRKGDIKEME